MATLDDERLRISAVDLDVRGEVPGISEEEFRRAAEEVEEACPVSNAVRNNVEVRLRAVLDAQRGPYHGLSRVPVGGPGLVGRGQEGFEVHAG